MEPRLDLEKAINYLCHSEAAIKKQQVTLQGTPTSIDNTIDAVHKGKPQHSRGKLHRQSDRPLNANTARNFTRKNNNYSRCGKSPLHPKPTILS